MRDITLLPSSAMNLARCCEEQGFDEPGPLIFFPFFWVYSGFELPFFFFSARPLESLCQIIEMRISTPLPLSSFPPFAEVPH